MLRADLFAVCLTLVAFYAGLAGGKAERRAAATLVLAWILTLLARRPFTMRFTSVELGILLVDLVMLAALIGITSVSHRRWPVWMTALQLVSVITHLVQAINPTGNWRGYQAMLAVNSWLIVALLAIATATRSRSSGVADPSWLNCLARWARRVRTRLRRS